MPHVSTCSYKKVVSILDTIAKVKLCLVMLDLECDALVVEMFQSFLKIIRSNYPLALLSTMETIMNLVIDESEDISLNLLSLLFASVRWENQNVSPTSWKLGEQIITRINAHLEKTMHNRLHVISAIITSIIHRDMSCLQIHFGRERVLSSLP